MIIINMVPLQFKATPFLSGTYPFHFHYTQQSLKASERFKL